MGALCILTAARPASADNESCAQSYEAAQAHRRDAKLLDARRDLVACGQDACPAVLRKDCVAWLTEVEAAIPQLAIHVRGPDGCDRPDAKVWVDGAERPNGASGLPIELDPGTHALRVVTDGQSATREVTLATGERSRAFTIAFAQEGAACHAGVAANPASTAPAPPPVTDEKATSPTLAYVMGGVGVAGLIVGSAFAVSAWSQKSTLDDCKGECKRRDVDTMRRTFLVADIGLTVAVIGLAAGAAYYFLTRRAHH